MEARCATHTSCAPACVETSLQLKEAPLANTGRYDRLRGVEAGDVAIAADQAEVHHG